MCVYIYDFGAYIDNNYDMSKFRVYVSRYVHGSEDGTHLAVFHDFGAYINNNYE